MDIQPTSTQPISDDQELAKVLAGVNNKDEEESDVEQQVPASQVTPPVAAGAPPVAAADENELPDLAMPDLPAMDAPVPADVPVAPAPAPVPEFTAPSTPMPTTSGSGELDDVKKDAINELRPLVDKLNISPEEKFDTYLLLIRSTDDRALVAPAHEAAKNIADEARRAQALLDIIKEIDFLSGGAQQP
jgi:hypothetical protein